MKIKPERLINGDKISLIAPSGRVSQNKVDISISNIYKLGFDFEILKPFVNYGHFSATDEERLYELEYFFDKNNEIKSIFCVRGGYGATRLLPFINYNLIKRNPKLFVGFSDITALQSAFFVKTGLISIHGIIAASEFSEYIIQQLRDLIFNPINNYILPAKSFDVLNEGKAKGQIVGGNLSVLVSLIGTEYLYSFENNIVFIEEIFEPPYKIDRMLNHLLMATDLKKASAIVFGNFNKCSPKDFNMSSDESFNVEEIIFQNFVSLNIPIVYNLNFGHMNNGLVFPIGVKAEINTEKKEIKLLETAVL